jgi:glucose/arabinose dehydrogenase
MVRIVLLLLLFGGGSALLVRWRSPPVGALLTPRFQGADRDRKQIGIALRRLAEGIDQPTDVQFPPGMNGWAVVLQKSGVARWLNVDRGTHAELFRVEVRTASEEGLLGIAFHPRFAQNGRFFINYVTSDGEHDVSRVAEWKLSPSTGALKDARAQAGPVLMEVQQPYPNHNAGQLAFGPDGYLYIGWGDGGAAFDPHGNGQDGSSLLGSMLRIDVDSAQRPYAVPKDNPFLQRPGFAPETWAYGLRNPWRYSFDPRGRLVIADVGQNRWEEIDLVTAGDNLGWNLKEGFECVHPEAGGCARSDLIDPVWAYGRDDGLSITGGYVATGNRVPALAGLYVFGDYGSGKLFAIALPDDRGRRVEQPIALGQWDMHPATFGRDAAGDLYLADFSHGDIYRLEAR